MSDATETKCEQIVELLEELVRWTRVTSTAKVGQILEEALRTPNEKVAYQISDGVKSQSEIARLSGLSQQQVSDCSNNWIKMCIAKSVSARGGQRAARLFSLDDFGIEIPNVVAMTAKTPTTSSDIAVSVNKNDVKPQP